MRQIEFMSAFSNSKLRKMCHWYSTSVFNL